RGRGAEGPAGQPDPAHQPLEDSRWRAPRHPGSSPATAPRRALHRAARPHGQPLPQPREPVRPPARQGTSDDQRAAADPQGVPPPRHQPRGAGPGVGANHLRRRRVAVRVRPQRLPRRYLPYGSRPAGAVSPTPDQEATPWLEQGRAVTIRPLTPDENRLVP